MDIHLPLDQMTREEKLRVLEEIQADLNRHEEEVESPGWHERELCKRDENVKSVGELSSEWETARTPQMRDQP